MLPTNFQFFWASSFREEDFQKLTNQKQELPVAPCLLTDRDEMRNIYKRHFIDAFVTSFGSFEQAVSEKILKKVDQSEK